MKCYVTAAERVQKASGGSDSTLAVVVFRDESFSELRHKAACIQLGFGMVFRNGTTSIWSHLPLKVVRRSGVVTRVLRGESANVSQDRVCSLRRRFHNNNDKNKNNNDNNNINNNNSNSNIVIVAEIT